MHVKRPIHPKPRRGISLVETVLSMLILGGAFVALLNTVSAARASQAVVADRQFARLLATDLMSEILGQTQYAESGVLGLELGEILGDGSRTNFDDVDDYEGWSATPPIHADGTAFEGAAGLTRTASVTRVDPDSPDTDEVSDQGLVRIVVMVKRGDKVLAEVQSFRSDVWRSPEESY